MMVVVVAVMVLVLVAAVVILAIAVVMMVNVSVMMVAVAIVLLWVRSRCDCGDGGGCTALVALVMVGLFVARECGDRCSDCNRRLVVVMTIVMVLSVMSVCCQRGSKSI